MNRNKEKAMNIVTIYASQSDRFAAHPGEFSQGLAGGHVNEVVQLYAMALTGLTAHDYQLDRQNIQSLRSKTILENSGGCPKVRPGEVAADKDAAYLVKMVRKFRPKDVVEQQRKIARPRV
jgi:hypothetical protein